MAKAPKQVPTAEIATTGGGRDITQPWVLALKEPRDRRLVGSIDWGAYETIRKDDQVKSCMQQRIGAVVSAEWDVLPGDETDPRSVEAADKLKDQLSRLGIDRWTEKKLWGAFYGYAVSECLWSIENSLVRLKALKVRHARRFRYDADDNLRLLTRANMAPGELLPVKKFLVVKWGATNDDEPYGEGLADWLYWPCLFKRNGIKFWNIFLDKYAAPTAKATYRRGTPTSDVKKILQVLQSMSTDSGFAVPEGVAVEFLEASRSGIDSYEKLARYMDEAIAKIILSQTMTTQNGSSLSQAQVHAGVKLEVVKADADILSDAFNGDDGPARWWTDWNYGPDVAAPKFVRMIEEEADLKVQADVDNSLKTLGWERTDESFQDTYGDGYVRTATGQTVPADPNAQDPAPNTPDSGKGTGNVGNGQQQPAVAFADFGPRPLYVYRRLKNAADLVAWARGQGFTSTVDPAEMHVTITYSRKPVDWFSMGTIWGLASGELTVAAGGPRLVSKMGDKGAIALVFGSDELEWRNKSMREKGASWDFPDYRPHVTICYEGAPPDLSEVSAYDGQLIFGPEMFEPVKERWDADVAHVELAEEGEKDIIDRIVADMMREQGWRPLSSQLTAVIHALEAAEDPKDMDQALVDQLDAADRELFTQMLARASFATRLAAEADIDQ